MGERTGGAPKALLEVGGRPLLAWLLDALGQRVSDACVVIDAEEETERRFREALAPFETGRRTRFVPQPEPRGVGDAVLRARGAVRGPFVVVMGDGYYGASLAPSIEEWVRSGTDGGVLVEHGRRGHGEPAGWVRTDGRRVRGAFKAADPDRSALRLAGMAILPSAALALDRPAPSPHTGEVELEQLVGALIDRGYGFRALGYAGWRRNVNHPGDLERIRRRVERRTAGHGRAATHP